VVTRIWAADVEEDLVGGGLGVGRFFDVIDEGGAGVEAREGGAGDFDAEVFWMRSMVSS
jgi:hypothetical protein